MTEPLDMSKDPDRYNPHEEPPTGPLDMSKDPDRYDPDVPDKGMRNGPTLPELLGEGANEDDRNNLTWLFGLLGVIAFLLLISALAQLGGGR